MPVTIEKLEKLEKLLSKVDLPFHKKSNLKTNINKLEWIRDNFDVKNLKHKKRQEIFELIEDILS